jgi:hypothetical protein
MSAPILLAPVDSSRATIRETPAGDHTTSRFAHLHEPRHPEGSSHTSPNLLFLLNKTATHMQDSFSPHRYYCRLYAQRGVLAQEGSQDPNI